MKISKKDSAIKGSEEVKAEEILELIEPVLPEEICDDQDLCDELGVVDSPKAIACDLIKQAIDVLAGIAETDEVARDNIANLSVVLFDLK